MREILFMRSPPSTPETVKRASTPTRRRSSSGSEPTEERPGQRWTFLSNHAHVLICLALDPHIRLRDVAERIGITERAVLSIVGDLETEGLVKRRREGRRNTYELHLDQPLRHPIEDHRSVGELVRLILRGKREA